MGSSGQWPHDSACVVGHVLRLPFDALLLRLLERTTVGTGDHVQQPSGWFLKSVAGLPRRKSVPVHVQQELGVSDTGAVRERADGLSSAVLEPVEPERRKTDRRELARQGQLSRIEHDSLLEPAGFESVCIHSGNLRCRTIRTGRIRPVFHDREFAAAAFVDPAEPEPGSVLQLDRDSG